MNPTQTGATVAIGAAATTLVAWGLMGFPTHGAVEVPPQIAAYAGAIVSVISWGGHLLLTKPWKAKQPGVAQ